MAETVPQPVQAGSSGAQPGSAEAPPGTTPSLQHSITPPSNPSSHRGFWSLIITQFQGAFSDNVLKNLVIFLALTGSASVAEQHALGEKVTALFSLPFILFSMAGGFLADRLSKRTVMLGVKVFEIVVMIFVLTGFALHNLHILLAAIFLMGTHSAFFGPPKYSSLPELLPQKELSWGNGILELGTFVAIILGTFLAGLLADKLGQNQMWSGVMLAMLAAIGLLACLGITKVPAAAPQKKFRLNFVAELIERMRPIRKDRPLMLAVAGNVYFSFLGSLLLLDLFFYGYNVLHVSKLQIGYLNVALALGIGLGSVAAGYLSGEKIEYGLVPIGAAGMAVTCATLAVPGISLSSALLRLALLGFSGGFFIVPISALLQHRPEKERKGEVLAAANLLSFVGVFLVWPVHYLLTEVLHWGPLQVFMFGAVLTLAGAVYALWLLPEALLRFWLWLLTRTIYRIKVLGRDNVPEHGGALLVCNHLSHVDALLLQASIDRPIRFLMFKGIYDRPWIKPLAKIMGVIPISSEQRPREMLQSLKAASDAVRAGELVCIFAEGQITRIGQLLPFRRGFERIMKDVDAPIIPVALDGVWGSIFSFEHKRFLWKLPRQIPYPVTACFGKAMPATATPAEVRGVVQELVAAAWQERKGRMQTLERGLVRTARKHPFRFAMADAQTPKLNFISVLIRSIVLSRRLRKTWAGQRMVGLLLPPSVGGALSNYSAALLGKVAVNLNYTVSESTLKSCVQQCSIKTIVTSKAFLEKVKLKLPSQMTPSREPDVQPTPERGLSQPAAMHTLPNASEVTKALDTSGLLRAGTARAPEECPETAVEAVFLEDLIARKPGFGETLMAVLLATVAPYGLLIRSLRKEKNEGAVMDSRERGGDGLGPASARSDVPREAGPRPSPPRSEIAGEKQQAAAGDVQSCESRLEGRPPPAGKGIDELATIIFSSGSTGEPKGVMLSHDNIGSNIEQMEQVFGLNADDKVLGILPFFHSFGFTGTLWLPAIVGIGAVYHGNPLDAKTIGPLVQEHAITFLLATPTFLQLYLRGCSPENFGSLRLVMTGAEKLPERLASAFEEHFGIRPLEGYGCTECSPAVAVNTQDFRASGVRQVGGKRGKIGHPLPGVSVRIVDPEKPDIGNTLPVGSAGLLLVRGPNIMQGYLGRPEKTAEVLRNGWYTTGDVAALDEDGFLQITDRLSRFSKIGGEMVPHIKVEENLHELAGVTEQTFVVTGVPDEKKGERLVVLHKLKEAQLQPVLEKLAQSDLPNLWKPRPDQFVFVEALPYLGTGKLDLRKVKEIAMKGAGEKS